jgi:PEP-CTERM motif
MGRVLRIAAVIALFACVAVGTAKADSQELSYSLTGPDGLTASFILPVNPVVAPGNFTLGGDFQVTPIDLIVNHVADLDGNVAFYSYDSMLGGGGFSVDNGDLIDLMNTPDFTQALYSGPESSPTMSDISGNIPLEDFMSFTTGYTLTITPVSTVPEPASLLLVGAGLVGLFVKRRLSVSQS